MATGLLLPSASGIQFHGVLCAVRMDVACIMLLRVQHRWVAGILRSVYSHDCSSLGLRWFFGDLLRPGIQHEANEVAVHYVLGTYSRANPGDAQPADVLFVFLKFTLCVLQYTAARGALQSDGGTHAMLCLLSCKKKSPSGRTAVQCWGACSALLLLV